MHSKPTERRITDMNLESTNTVSLLSAISANTETIAEMQNELTELVSKIKEMQVHIATDHDQVWGQINEVHNLLETLNETNEYYCDRCHDLLVMIAGLIFIGGLFAIIGKLI